MTDATPPASLPRTVAVCVGAVILFEILRWIAVPGFDLELLAELGMRPMSVADGVMWVVVARAVLALSGLPGGPLWMLIPYAGAAMAALQGMESLEIGWQPAVLEPGLGFRVVGTLTMLGGASLLWVACDRVSATGRVSGPVWIGAWAALPALASFGTELGVEVAYGLRTALATLLVGGLLMVPPLVLGGVVAIRGLPDGPFLGRLRFRSTLDAPLSGLVLSWLALQAMLWFGTFGLPPLWLPGLVATTVAGLAAREIAQHDARDAPAPLLHLIGPALSALVLSGALVGYVAREGLPIPQPSPWSGVAAFTVVVSSSSPSAETDGARLAARLEGLGVDVAWKALDPHRVELDISSARSPEILDVVLPPGQLEILDGQGGRLTNAHIADASVGWNEWGPYVSVVLTPTGARGFCEMSTASVGHQIHIVLDGVVRSSPMVREPICGGRISIDMGGAGDPTAEANALALVLRSGAPLGATWTVDSIR